MNEVLINHVTNYVNRLCRKHCLSTLDDTIFLEDDKLITISKSCKQTHKLVNYRKNSHKLAPALTNNDSHILMTNFTS